MDDVYKTASGQKEKAQTGKSWLDWSKSILKWTKQQTNPSTLKYIPPTSGTIQCLKSTGNLSNSLHRKGSTSHHLSPYLTKNICPAEINISTHFDLVL